MAIDMYKSQCPDSLLENDIGNIRNRSFLPQELYLPYSVE